MIQERPLPPGYTCRPAAHEDADAVLGVLNACSLDAMGVAYFSEDYLRTMWADPQLDLGADTRVVCDPAGEVVGYALAISHSPHVRVQFLGAVPPEHRGRGIGSHLYDWVHNRARQLVDQAAPEARVALITSIPHQDAPSRALLEAQGLAAVRHFWAMEIPLDEAPPAPVLPDGITIRGMTAGEDDRPVFRVVHESFRDAWGYVERPFEEAYAGWREHVEAQPEHDPTLDFLALDGDTIAGVALCLPRSWDDPDKGWIGILGVLRDYRRRGIASALLRHAFGEFYRRGQKRAGLGVDSGSLTGAQRLYEQVGMHVRYQFVTYEKELRPGVDLVKQS
jgi:mycothiol synthase